MDWLAITIARDGDIEQYVKQKGQDLPPKNQSYTWTVATGAENLALRGSLACATPEGQNSRDDGENSQGQNSGDDGEKSQKAVRIRQRLGELTRWVGPASKPAISVASAIATVMNTLVDDKDYDEFCWFLKVAVKESDHENNSTDSKTDSKIKFKVKRQKAATQCGWTAWTADATEIEAALSLWIYHIRECERFRQQNQEDLQPTAEGKKDSDRLQEDVLLVRKSTRLLGVATPKLERDLKWWIGNVQKFDKTQESNDPRHLLIGFTGLESKLEDTATGGCISLVSRKTYL
jgi:hypothetical protein